MTSAVDAALNRLNLQLPLAARQRSLPPELAALHRAILRSLYERGRPLTCDEIAGMVAPAGADAALLRLAADDLVVLSEDRRNAVGAYPMTTEPTPHRLILAGRTVNAMCALDALSVTLMFGGEVEIRSTCRVTGQPVRIRQRGENILEAEPSGVVVGIRWQMPRTCHAAHSMCMEMVFLASRQTALAWHGDDLANHSLLTLQEAIGLGASFFRPLIFRELPVAG